MKLEYQTLEEYNEALKQEYQEQIRYYVAESKTPAVRNMN